MLDEINKKMNKYELPKEVVDKIFFEKYKSPVELIQSDPIIKKIEDEQEKYIMGQINCVVKVDKDELIKALEYDRDSYRKGVSAGYMSGYRARDEEIVRCKDCIYVWKHENGCYECGNGFCEVKADFYCADGERKETE